jgi:hypothetical protein
MLSRIVFNFGLNFLPIRSLEQICPTLPPLDKEDVILQKVTSFRINVPRMGLEEMGCESVEWIKLAQDMVHWRVFVNMVKNV